MSATHNPRADASQAGSRQPEPAPGETVPGPMTDDWVPDDRAPTAAESNFMSVSLFAFLILFGIGCFIIF